MTRSIFRIHEDVAQALAAKKPVVALESTLLVHGLPRATSREVASKIERVVRAEGAIPATIGIVGGTVVIGLTEREIDDLTSGPQVPKVGVRDLSVVVATGSDGATTVASTSVLAQRAGIAVFATGGLGGVHRGAAESWDESTDLITLSRTPITVVSAGVKSILDVGATLERLETLAVTVLGFQTSRFPGFYLSDSGFPIDWRVETEREVAGIMSVRDALGLPGAILVANPLPLSEQLDPVLHDRILAEALAEAERQGIRGKVITPFLLEYFHEASEQQSLLVNTRIIYRNAQLAARIARAWARQKSDR